MNYQEIYQQLEKLGTAQNRKIYKRHGAGENLFGVSFAHLKELRKKVISPNRKKGKNHTIAQQLWKTQNIDAQTFAAMIADPQQVTEVELDAWVQDIHYYGLTSEFAQLAANAPFSQKKMEEWIQSDQEFIRRVGYDILNKMAREDETLSNEFFEPYIHKMEKELQQSPNRAKEGMNNCLIAIGARNEALRQRVLKAAEKIGKVEIDHGETSCKTFIIEEYLDKIYERKAQKK
jgi:3-methyladenine DNA glycosylase AlkD